MAELNPTLDELFRREKGRVVGGLLRRLGNLDAAEEAFADAVLAALTSWPSQGLPDNPAAWLTATAQHRALDGARHRRVVEQKAPLLIDRENAAAPVLESVPDDELRLIFACCHPVLPLPSRVALTLKVVADFTTDEIARAFLIPEKTAAQRIVRAKRTIEAERLAYEVPSRAELPPRLASVLAVIYLIFNEGHTAQTGPLLRLHLQQTAWRLSRSLCDLLPKQPEAFGLLALIALSLARAATRTDEEGAPVLLAQQDRARWHRPLIKEGLMALERARRLAGRESYVLQAEIAACHVTAPIWERTDWRAILRLYNELLRLDDSPVVALNRSVAVCMLEGPEAGLVALVPLEVALARYHLFYSLRADFRRRLGHNDDARGDYRRALTLVGNDGERRFLQRQLAELGTTFGKK